MLAKLIPRWSCDDYHLRVKIFSSLANTSRIAAIIIGSRDVNAFLPQSAISSSIHPPAPPFSIAFYSRRIASRDTQSRPVRSDASVHPTKTERADDARSRHGDGARRGRCRFRAWL